MIHVDLGGYAFHSTFPYLDQLTHEQLEDYQHVFRPSGYVYSPFGGMIDGIRGLEHYRVLVVLRDPRDVLTSEFFSIRHSHRTPPVASDKHAQFSALRNRARALTIDEYVLSESPRVRATYQRYIDRLLEPGHDVGVLKYEDMIADFPKWLGQLERFCELSISPQLRGRLTSSARQAAARKERIASHARQLLPGDHRRKLHGATIGELNRRFAEILDRLEYDPS